MTTFYKEVDIYISDEELKAAYLKIEGKENKVSMVQTIDSVSVILRSQGHLALANRLEDIKEVI